MAMREHAERVVRILESIHKPLPEDRRPILVHGVERIMEQSNMSFENVPDWVLAETFKMLIADIKLARKAMEN